MRLIQTSENDSVCVVCYSPEKRQHLYQSQSNKTPVKITETCANKRPSLLDEYTIPKKSKITPTKLEFSYDDTFSHRFHTASEALSANIYETVELKVKVMIKSNDKQTVVRGDKTRYKADTIVADETGSIK
jgi:hypothetical protein